MIISFIIPGNPIPWARAGGNGKRRFNDPKVVEYKRLIGYHALAARNTAQIKLGIRWPKDAIYAVECVVHRKDERRFDADRVLNNVADACIGILFEDDRQKFLRDARVVVGDAEPKEPWLGVTVWTRDAQEHREIVRGLEMTIERVGDGQR